MFLLLATVCCGIVNLGLKAIEVWVRRLAVELEFWCVRDCNWITARIVTITLVVLHCWIFPITNKIFALLICTYRLMEVNVSSFWNPWTVSWLAGDG